MKYKYTFNALNNIGDKSYHSINILGGGIKDRLLCQMTSDACNVPVLAGPTEATVMGNIGVAFSALGEIKDFNELRRVVSNSTEIKTYAPTDSNVWEKAYADYLKATRLC